MRTSIGMLAALAIAVSGAGAPGAMAAAAKDEAPKKEKKICRTSKMTGSLTRRSRICMTEAQWRELNDRTRRGVDEMVGSASGAPSCLSAIDVACNPEAAGPAGGIPPGSF